MLRLTIKCNPTLLFVTRAKYFHRRSVHFAVNLGASPSLVSDAVKAEVKTENEDISTMDRCMKIIRERADPAYHNVIPLRIPKLWAEALAASTPGAERSADLKSTTTVDLTPRNMHDSYSELILPFGSSKEFFELYTNAWGGIRTGKILEHLDSLAGSIAYKHMLGPVRSVGNLEERGFYIVTASVDRLDMLKSLDPARDLRLSGHLIYTGRSSMEVAVRMESLGTDQPPVTVMIGRFSMVCRDASTRKARRVNPLMYNTQEEKALYNLGEQMKQRRQLQASRSLSKVPPNSSEAAELHSFYLKHEQLFGHELLGNEDRLWMEDAIQERCMLMFPQERNVHGKVFGGFLMRLAYELGFTNASMFTRGRVRFLSSDGISFAHPVSIGSILLLKSQILHTSLSYGYPLVHVGVKANVVDVKTGAEETTNDFRFTCCQVTEPDNSNFRVVVPKSYKEAMLWLEGKRALELGAEIRGSRRS